MRLWISGEIEKGVGDDFPDVLRELEGKIGPAIAKNDYGLELDSWDCIAIIRNDHDFSERVRYSRKKRDMDFRLRIEYGEYQKADRMGRLRLMFAMLMRTIDLLEKKSPDRDGLSALRSDVVKVGKKEGWLAD